MGVIDTAIAFGFHNLESLLSVLHARIAKEIAFVMIFACAFKERLFL